MGTISIVVPDACSGSALLTSYFPCARSADGSSFTRSSHRSRTSRAAAATSFGSFVAFTRRGAFAFASRFVSGSTVIGLANRNPPAEINC